MVMKDTKGMRLTLTRTACHKAAQKGLTPDVIQAVFDNPERIYPNETREGQFCITGRGVTFVGVFLPTEFKAITVRGSKG